LTEMVPRVCVKEQEVVSLGIEIKVEGRLQIRRCLGKMAEVVGGGDGIHRRRSSLREVPVPIHVDLAL
jgi:hypothetical protein